MLYKAKERANISGIPFDLLEKDIFIPEVCHVLGIPMYRGTNGKLHDGSPTIDRLVPSLGYVKDNISVISHRANRIKQNATIEELEKIVQWMRLQ